VVLVFKLYHGLEVCCTLYHIKSKPFDKDDEHTKQAFALHTANGNQFTRCFTLLYVMGE